MDNSEFYSPNESQDIQEVSQNTLKEKFNLFNGSAKGRSISAIRNIASLFLLAVIAGSSLYFANRLTRPTPVPTKSSAQSIQTVKIMNVYYIPPTSSYANNPNYLKDLRDATKIYLGYASAYHHDLTKQAVQYSEVGPVYIRTDFRPAGTGDTDRDKKVSTMTQIVNDRREGISICELVNALNLDEVWLWADPTVDKTLGDEFAMVGPTSNYGNPWYNGICAGFKTFVVMGFDVTFPPLTGSVHSYAHYLEELAREMQGDELVLGQFQGVQMIPGDGQREQPYPGYQLSERCGNVHTPPNVPIDPATNTYPGYDYGNSTDVQNNICEDFKTDGTSNKKSVSAIIWQTMDLPKVPDSIQMKTNERYLIWWLQNMPSSANPIYYNGKIIPGWWEFVVDRDAKITKYKSDPNYWINPAIQVPIAAAPSSYCLAQSGASTKCTYTPGNSVLGTSTESKSVLAATTYGNLAIVTVAYSTSNTSLKVSSVKYCGAAMTRVGTGPANGGGMKTEMWYKTAPATGTCDVVTTFSADPGERVISSTLFSNIDQVVPLGEITTGGYSGPYSAVPSTITATLTGAKDSLMLCTYDLYSEQTNGHSNNAEAQPGTKQLWIFEDPRFQNGGTVNVWAGLGAGVQRTVANQSTTLTWKTYKKMPSSYTCANFNVKPFGVVSGTPLPSPTTVPTSSPVPTVVPTSTPTPTKTPTPTPVPTKTPTPTPVPTPVPTTVPNVTYLQVPQVQVVTIPTSQHVGYESSLAIDGNISTFWHTEWTPIAPLPQWVWLTSPNMYKVGKLTYLPRQDGAVTGNITNYTLLASADGVNTFVVASGTWPDNKNLKTVTFTPTNMKYLALIANAGNGGYASAAEINLWYQTPVDETNDAVFAPSQITTTGTSQHVGFETARVSDNNTSTFWNSEWNPYAPLPQSVTLALGGTFPIGKIVYTPRQDGSPVGNITNYRVYVSLNGTSFTQVTSGQWPDDSSPKTAAFFPVFANYVKLEAVNGNSNYASAAEITVWQSPIRLSYGSTATATSQHVGFEASRAADTSSATFWHSEWSPYAPLPQSLTLRLGGQFTVKGLIYLPRQDGSLTGTVTSYKIFTSLDGVNYTLVYTGVWADNSSYKSVVFPPVNASYVKMQVDSGDAGYASAALFAIMY